MKKETKTLEVIRHDIEVSSEAVIIVNGVEFIPRSEVIVPTERTYSKEEVIDLLINSNTDAMEASLLDKEFDILNWIEKQLK